LTENPYAVTQIDVTAAELAQQKSVKPSIGSIVKSIFLGWEKWRLIFNAIVCGFIFVMFLPRLSDLPHLGAFVRAVVFINIIYFAGPILEMMLYGIAIRGRGVRWVLFSIGIFLIMSFIFLVINVSIPDQE
jgi:hypothetical protein